jgi:hypothetical protein
MPDLLEFSYLHHGLLGVTSQMASAVGLALAHRLIAIDHRRGRDLKGKKPRKTGAGNETLKTTC